MDQRLFSEWAQVDDHLRRAIIVRDALGCGQRDEPRRPQTYHDWSSAEGNMGGVLFVIAREERGAYIRRKLYAT